MLRLVHRETTRFDPDALERLVRDLGVQAAERGVGAALDDIFEGLRHVRAARRHGGPEDVQARLRSIAVRARRIGLPQVARVAEDAAGATARADSAAAGATLARLERLFDGAAKAIGRGWSATS